VSVYPDYIRHITQEGFTVVFASRWLNAVVVETYGRNPQFLRSHPFVKEVEPVKHVDVHVSERGTSTPLNYGQTAQQIGLLSGDFLHSQGFTGQGMLIAVIDAGFVGTDFMAVFDSLRTSGRLVDTYDFVEGEASVYDNDGTHGTAVLSTMAGLDPGVYVGAAPHADYALYTSEIIASETRVEEYNWLAAAERADSIGADVINTSLGYTTFDDPAESYSFSDMDGNTTFITQAADWAASRGILVVASAGNSGMSAWGRIGAPADGDSVLAVGGTNLFGTYVAFSSRGPSADGRVKPDVAGPAADVKIHTAAGIFGANGTSFSSPIIAALAACAWQKYPQHNAWEIADAIRLSGHQASNPDSLMGYGVPDFAILDASLSQPEFTVSDNSSILIYPNPADAHIWIEANEPIEKVSILSQTGQEVWVGFIDGKASVQISTESLPSGVYYVLVYSREDMLQSKFLIE
jgi:hypothetical protein